MTKTKTKPVGDSASKPRTRKPKWLRDLGDLSAPDMALWQAIQQDSLPALQKRAMIMGKDVYRLRQRAADLRAIHEIERRELLGKIAHLQQAQTRTRESQAWGMMNAMLNCLESNSRAVHAMAEPMQRVLEELAKEIPDKWPQPKED